MAYRSGKHRRETVLNQIQRGQDTDRLIRTIFNKKQERTLKEVKKGVPLAKEMKENIPEIWITKNGPQQFVKVNGALFTIPMASYPKGDLKDTMTGEAFATKQYVDKNAPKIKVFNIYDASPTAGTHHMMIDKLNMESGSAGWTGFNGGTGTDPATSLSVGGSSSQLVGSIWYIPSKIEIEEVRVLAAADGSCDILFHLYSYNIDSGTDADAGNLSDGILLAHNASVLACNSDRVMTTKLTVDERNVAADKVVVAFYESTTTDDFTGNLYIKYRYI